MDDSLAIILTCPYSLALAPLLYSKASVSFLPPQDGLVYADVGTFNNGGPRRIPPPPKEPVGVQYSEIVLYPDKQSQIVEPSVDGRLCHES